MSAFNSEQLQQLTELISMSIQQSQFSTKVKTEQEENKEKDSPSSTSPSFSKFRPSSTFGTLPILSLSDSNNNNTNSNSIDSSKTFYKPTLVTAITLPILGSTISAAQFSSFKFKVKNKLQINDLLLYIEHDHDYM